LAGATGIASYDDTATLVPPGTGGMVRQVRARRHRQRLDEDRRVPDVSGPRWNSPGVRYSDTGAPAAWPAHAAKQWEDLPPDVREAVLKRERDVEKGISDLKNRYAAIDEAHLKKPH
jgi:hypothetical protein